ncbi:hypothetical protein LINGRAHAP2_LOCUS16082 [Linum grandiflorum]
MGNCLFNGVPEDVETDAIVIVDVSNRPSLSSNAALPDVIWGCSGSGVWKVELVISAAELAEILAEDSRTEELIESARTVAKSGGRRYSTSSRNGAVSEDLSVS